MCNIGSDTQEGQFREKRRIRLSVAVSKFICVGGDAVTRQSWSTVPLDCSREDRASRACSELPRIAHYPSFSFFMLIVLLYAVHDSRCRRQQVSHSKPSAALCSFSSFFTNHFHAVSFLLIFSLSLSSFLPQSLTPPLISLPSRSISFSFYFVRFCSRCSKICCFIEANQRFY